MKIQLIPVAVALLILSSCSSQKAEEKAEESDKKTTEVVNEKPVEVKAKLLTSSDFAYELICNGTIVAMQKADLRFQSQDIIRKIYVKNGQRVRKGEKLAELDKFKLEIAFLQAKESLERARLDLQDVLIGQGYALSDTAKVSHEVMKIAKIRSNYEQSENNYKVAEYNLKAATLYAPFDGVVANLTAKEYNQPGGDAFCTLINNYTPEVVFNILENELPFTKIHDKVIVSPFSQPGHKVEGRISEINPLIDKNGMVKVKAVLTNKDNTFYEGMNVKIHVQRLLGEQLVIPKSALVLRTNRKVVFTLKNGQANWVYVATEQENSDSYVVTEGLQAGDSIIYEGNINLAHETKVQVQ
ncbi:efflux RND transporter periplasmic adaptor subunit [Bacteroides sp. 224]|uniref:efflux RND transporter periplasmic adaptor subunit n=1 Tax=Bacteroides sp. 224 TaxID=2302936 RepID=UPI0013D5697D|nr:efflux RND transporter periplasmic adaptor subunit [Bacteroides sp. 224]NDV65516.1 efflux RND transporter periplasmic adaptor subunit [Bacteroides sp. 224]